MRLNRFLAQAGITSRRKADDLIRAGRIKINGVLISALGTQVDPVHDSVTLDDRPVRLESSFIYILLNKPRGYLVSTTDTYGRSTVFELLQAVPYRVFSVGRLDYDTAGALLFTNDGDLAYRLMHPRYEIKKVYLARVQGIPDTDDLDRLRQGVRLNDFLTSPAEAVLQQVMDGNALVKLVLHEGKKRQVKRMCKAIGHPVQALYREAFAGISLHGLPGGQWRYLRPEEVESLHHQTGLM